MRKTMVSILLILVVFSSACIEDVENTDASGTSAPSGSANPTYPLTEVPYGVIELDTLAEYGNVTVVRATYGYVIFRDDTKVFLNVSEAYFFPWGFVVVETVPEVRGIPIVNVRIGRTYEEDSRNITAMVGVTRIEAYDYTGHLLWVHEPQPPYIWEITRTDDGGEGYEKGVSYPRILISNSSEYLFIAELPRSFGNMVSLPVSAGDVCNYLYVYGGNGLVERFNFSSSGRYRVNNEFLLSAGNYTVFGFQMPYEDGSPNYGEVLLFNGSEVIFRRRFDRDPECLCDVIHGWARIYPGGCVYFGLLEGTGFYCRGTFRYIKKENG
ncbi:hypothetical protein CL1_0564 [Thermococcus cleftensis]|uniref:Uncharacterized protein n=1 Tax=Thermococcus cleftensis (strain DSM 27260 / KACC 17922 / CL1) TaxID=163003 RepID=I3ZST7_THECF|nr:hypothetical protein [Thermococcus cleftensis]AFL94771.1 hypothetical protein CL1_0564 [Thermococcus cleftensis]